MEWWPLRYLELYETCWSVKQSDDRLGFLEGISSLVESGLRFSLFDDLFETLSFEHACLVHVNGRVNSGSEFVVFRHDVWHGLNSEVPHVFVLHPRHGPEELGEGAFVRHRLHDHDVNTWVFVYDAHPSQASECVYHVERPLVDVVQDMDW